MNGRLGQVRRPILGGLAALVLFAIVPILYASGGDAQKHIAIVLILNATMVVGTQIFGGNTGVLSFGHVGLVAIAAYTSAILSTPVAVKASTIHNAPFGLAQVQLPVPLAILVAILVTTVFAAIVGLAICRLHGIAGSITTFALLMVINAVLINWKGLTGGAEAFYGIPIKTNMWWAFLGLAVAVLVGRLFMTSRLGLRVRSAREDELAADSLGVRVNRSRYWSWVLSAAIVAIGGALLGHLLGAISPSMFFETLMFLQMAMLVLGGMYSVTGALLGALVIGVASEAMRWLGGGPTIAGVHIPQFNGLSSLVYGLVILVVMIWWPGGFLDDKEIDLLWTWWRRRKAKTGAAPEAAVAAGPAPSAASPAPRSTPAAAPRAAGTTLLSVRDATMLFAGLRAVDKASLDVYPGEILGLIGPNGAGKTTLLNMISGIYHPTSGTFAYREHDLTGLDPYEIARLGIARTFQSIRLFPHLSVWENIETCTGTAGQYRRELYRPTEQIMEGFGLTALAERKAGTLSYGLQRQVEMARAVALGPELLMLDEPAAGTNEIESQQLAESIRRVRDQEKCSIILIDHDLPFVMNLCDRIYVLDAGAVIASGTPQEIQENPRVKQAYLGTRPVGAGQPGQVQTQPGGTA
jgi:branched-chain amino acid transport system permease protein